MPLSPDDESHARTPARAAEEGVAAWVLGCFGLYLAAQFALRLVLSPSAELDEAEQLLLTQSLALVYGSQPPLYTWLQWLVFAATGPSIAGLALLKNLLLFMTYGGTFLLASSLSGDQRKGALAALMMLLIPQVVWESQRDLTHSVLVTTVCVWTLLALRALEKRPSPARFALLGLAAGLGILSKYNYALFAAALFLAILSLPEFRRLFARRTALVLPGTALAVIAPHLAAALGQTARVTADIGKFGIEEAGEGAPGIATGLLRLALAVAAYLGPLTAVAAAVWLDRRRKGPGGPEAPSAILWRTLLGRAAAFAIALCAALAVFAGVTEFKDRWMQPLLFFAPVLIVLWFRGGVGRRLLGFSVSAGVIVGLVVLALIFGRTWISARGRLAEPYPAFAAQIRAAVQAPALIVAGDRHVGGNLRLRFPQAVVLSPETPPPPLPHGGEAILVWKPRPDGLSRQRAEDFLDTLPMDWEPQGQPQTLESLRLHSSTERSFLNLLALRAGAAHPPGDPAQPSR